MKQDKLIIGLLIATFLLLASNSYQLSRLGGSATITGAVTSGAISTNSITPTGTPKIYGPEIGVSFDDVTPNDRSKTDLTIRKMANLDREISLEGEDLKRYIEILYNKEGGMSCEYCCGAKSIIFENGGAACGCAHSFAMRGLAKYLITEHGDEYTDDEILEEVGKWKILFFPAQIAAKAQTLKEKGIEPGIINLASNKYRGIEKGITGGMVGGC